MTPKNTAGVEIRFSAPISSLKGTGGDRRATQSKVDYLIRFDDGSTACVAGNAVRELEVFNTAEFTWAIHGALSESGGNAHSNFPPRSASSHFTGTCLPSCNPF
jgi:hypothetical protein